MAVQLLSTWLWRLPLMERSPGNPNFYERKPEMDIIVGAVVIWLVWKVAVWRTRANGWKP